MQNTSVDNYLDIGPQNDKSHGIFGFHGFRGTQFGRDKERLICPRSQVHHTESGFYYLQSRYYDPELGRFLNADALVSTGQGLLGHNMFAYCNNNPVCLADPYGTCGYIAGTAIWKSCGDPSCPYYSQYTLSVGTAVGISLGPFTYGLQLALVTDSLGYSEIQLTYFVPISSTTLASTLSTDEMLAKAATYEKFNDVLDVSIMGNFSCFNTPSVSNLHNEGYQVGGTWGEGTAIALDYNIVPNGSEKAYTGITFSCGFGSTDAHASMGYTVPLHSSKLSVYDFLYAAHSTIYR